jgi:hypothetical protein
MGMVEMKEISGTPQPQARTSCADAWLGGYYSTVRLLEDLDAVRVHVRGGVAAAAKDFLATGAGSLGRWFAVGDVILTRTAYTDSRALPAGFSKVDWCVLKAGSVVNVGHCHPLFGHSGGGEQVELVSGPVPDRETVEGSWSDRAGRA